jgi:hypothetical protein
MKKAMALTLVLGVALPAAAIAQESTTRQPVAKHDTAAAKPPTKIGAPTQKNPGKSRVKAAQVPSQVSAGSPAAAAQKRDARTADGPASSDETTENAAKKPVLKKKKTADTPPDEKTKPQS